MWTKIIRLWRVINKLEGDNIYLEKIDDERINEVSKNDVIDEIELNNDILIRKVLLGD